MTTTTTYEPGIVYQAEVFSRYGTLSYADGRHLVTRMQTGIAWVILIPEGETGWAGAWPLVNRNLPPHVVEQYGTSHRGWAVADDDTRVQIIEQVWPAPDASDNPELDAFKALVRTRIIEEAERRNWCGEADAFLIKLGLEGREREWTVTFNVPVHVRVSAANRGEAIRRALMPDPLGEAIADGNYTFPGERDLRSAEEFHAPEPAF